MKTSLKPTIDPPMGGFLPSVTFLSCFDVHVLLWCEHQSHQTDPETLQSDRNQQKVRGQAEIMIARLFVFCARGRLCSRACCSLACFGVGGVAEPSAADLGTPGDCGVAVFIHACVCVLRGRVWSG